MKVNGNAVMQITEDEISIIRPEVIIPLGYYAYHTYVQNINNRKEWFTYD